MRSSRCGREASRRVWGIKVWITCGALLWSSASLLPGEDPLEEEKATAPPPQVSKPEAKPKTSRKKTTKPKAKGTTGASTIPQKKTTLPQTSPSPPPAKDGAGADVPLTRNGKVQNGRPAAKSEPAPPADKAPASAGPPPPAKAAREAAAGPGQAAAGQNPPLPVGKAAAGKAAPPAPEPAGGPAAGAQPGARGPAAAPSEATIYPEMERVGQKVYISEGRIPLIDFLKFLSDYTGLPLLHDSSDQNIATKEIHLAAEIREADEEVVKAILEVNRFRVFREVLPSGKEVLKVESMQPTAAAPDDPKETPIIKTDELDVSRERIGVGSDEFATMVFELKHTAPRDAAEALTSLVSGRPVAPGQPAAVRGTKSFSMVDVKNTNMLIITAKFGLLNYIKKLLELIDVPVQEPERIIHIIDVQEADAEEMVNIITEFLQGQGLGRGRTGLGGRRFGPGTRPTTQPTPTPTPTVPGLPGTAGQTEYRTNLIADYRTNKIIVETYSEQDLQDILMLISELDVRFDLRRLKTHIYQVRYLKAEEVAGDLQALLSGSGAGGLSGLRRGAGGATGARGGARLGQQRRTGVPRTGALPTAGPGGVAQPGGGSQNAPIPSLIVPHLPTNSLLIQAEPEEYDEILNILSKIDTKRRQVFLEAALVQVQSQSSLNYTIELLAGNPDDEATRALAASSFGLSGIDVENFQRVVPDLSDPAAVPPGLLGALMHNGKLPLIVSFFKQNRDSQILATPFVLADDNMENVIEILETRFVVNTATVNTSTTSSQQGEPAGITLALTPTISGSEKAVFLQLELTVSEFQEATTPIQQTLPPKNENTMTSMVTIPDGKVFVVGGLTRQNKSKAVSKVPIVGDIPLIGKLFRSESTVQNQNNLYVFLQAHVLTDEEFADGADLTRQGEEKMHHFDPSLKPVQFQKPEFEKKAHAVDANAPETFFMNPGKKRERGRPSEKPSASTSPYPETSSRESPRSYDARGRRPASRPPPAPAAERDGWLLAPGTAAAAGEAPDSGEE